MGFCQVSDSFIRYSGLFLGEKGVKQAFPAPLGVQTVQTEQKVVKDWITVSDTRASSGVRLPTGFTWVLS